METATRDAHGRFKPGCSGNPAGKPPGALNRATKLKRWLDDPEADGKLIARSLVTQAVKGNVTAIRIALDRLDPKPRARPIDLELAEGATFTKRFDAVFSAMAAGEVTPEEALQVARYLDTFSKVADWEDADEDALDRIKAETDASWQAYVDSLRAEFERREDGYVRRIATAEAKAAAAALAANTPDAPIDWDAVYWEAKRRYMARHGGEPAERIGAAWRASQARVDEPAEPNRQTRERAQPEGAQPEPGAPVAAADAPRAVTPSAQPSARQGERVDAGDAASPRRDPREYARPLPTASAEPESLNPTSISTGWGGRRRARAAARGAT